MSDLPEITQPFSENQAQLTLTGSPFTPGLPLEAHQSIFGRAEAFTVITAALLGFKSVNLIGERRMGKTSLLNHILGNRDAYFQFSASQPPLTLVRLDLQENISNEKQFYGKALLRLIEALPPQFGEKGQDLKQGLDQLDEKSEATAIQFEKALIQLKDVGVRPVFLIDEFERVFEKHLAIGFPFPDFYDNLRAHITAKRFVMVLFTRQKLIKYFTQQSLTSNFPSYFQPFTIKELDKDAADELLLQQQSDQPLTTEQARQARSWAGLHPCRLQCAGEAWYQAKSSGKPAKWAKDRYDEIVEPLGFINPAHLPVWSGKGLVYQLKQPRCWLPLCLVIGLVGLAWFRKMHWLTITTAWCKDNPFVTVILFIIVLMIFGKVTVDQVIKRILSKFLGDDKEEKK